MAASTNERSIDPPNQPAITTLSAQSFDILPSVHELLARIEHTSLAISNPISSTNSTGQSGAVPALVLDAAIIAETGAAYADLQPLDPKDLPGEILPIKGRIRRAMKELEELPDMDRDVEEQEEEIAELEARIKAQSDMLAKLGQRAAISSAQVGGG